MRGDVYWLKPPRDAKGHEQKGSRYVVVVQADVMLLSTWLVAPTSTSARPASFRPEIEIDGKVTRVLVEQTRAVDPQRLGDFAGRLPLHEMSEINDALRTVLDL
ncbi:MAG: type II toxin-antitoxin system PemK/MazF family toxin [Actinophytocola sp.]|nr:type II toxin-antitoxin system PemK/MazF family toxin [Actinophytocola sp.]